MTLVRLVPRVLVLPLALLALALAAGGRPGPASLPIKLSDSLTWSVEASLGGKPAVVTIDTGAAVCRFAPSTLAGARPAGTAPGTGRPAEPPSFDLVRVPSLAIGPTAWSGAVVASWPLLDEMHVAGIVSARVFDGTPVTLDPVARRLIFEDDAGLRGRVLVGVSVPLVLRREGEASLLPLLRATVDGASRLLVLDTGLPNALELESAAGPHSVSLAPGLSRTSLESYQRATPGADGRLGLRFFERKTLTLDLPRSRLIVSR